MDYNEGLVWTLSEAGRTDLKISHSLSLAWLAHPASKALQTP